MVESYTELQGEPQDINDHPTNNFTKLARSDTPVALPLEPQGSISRVGQDAFRREIRRDSVTGSFRTKEEGASLSTTRTKP